MGHEAEVIDLVELDMPMFTVARSKELDTVPGMAGSMKSAMSSSDSWMIIRARVQRIYASDSKQCGGVVKHRMARLPCSIQPS